MLAPVESNVFNAAVSGCETSVIGSLDSTTNSRQLVGCGAVHFAKSRDFNVYQKQYTEYTDIEDFTAALRQNAVDEIKRDHGRSRFFVDHEKVKIFRFVAGTRIDACELCGDSETNDRAFW